MLIPMIYHHFLFFLCPDVHNIPYTAVKIKGDPKTATEHTLTLTDVRTEPVIRFSVGSDIEEAVCITN